MIEATKEQVRVWIERQRADLTASLDSCDRALAIPAFKVASPQRTRLEMSRATVLVDLGVLETLWACHERWRLAREGMYATLEYEGEALIPRACVKYASGPMNEIAFEIWAETPREQDNQHMVDVTPIFDKMREVYEKA